MLLDWFYRCLGGRFITRKDERELRRALRRMAKATRDLQAAMRLIAPALKHRGDCS